MDSTDNKNTKIQLAIDITIKIGVLLLLLIWCFQIISPFISIVIWAIIIAVSFYPLFKTLAGRIGGKKKLAAALITLASLAVIIIPTAIFTNSLADGISNFKEDIENKTLSIPPPTDDISDIPLLGGTLYETWKLASENIMAFFAAWRRRTRRSPNLR